MKKKYIFIPILAVVCIVAFGAAIYTKNEDITEYDEETYYVYEETGFGTELNPLSEDYTPTESVSEELETDTDVSDENTLTFTGTIIDHVLESLVPVVCVKTLEENVIPYEAVFFELPDDEADWGLRIGKVVTITCEDSFSEQAPYFGTLISIEDAEVNPDELADIFGISISLPENPNWIVDSEYHLEDKNHLEITYHDSIVDSDCVILVTKNEALILPENEYDETLNESWEGRTINGRNIIVKVYYGKNESKTVLATWEYDEYQFAIIGEIEGDSGPIAKVALSIIYDLN